MTFPGTYLIGIVVLTRVRHGLTALKKEVNMENEMKKVYVSEKHRGHR